MFRCYDNEEERQDISEEKSKLGSSKIHNCCLTIYYN